MLHQMVTPVISRHKHDFNRYDAFGNAIGNSIVGGIQKSAAEERQAKAQLEARIKAAALGASNIVNGVQTDANGVTTDALTRQLQQDSVNLGNASGAQAAGIVETLVKTTPVNYSVRDVGGINALSSILSADAAVKQAKVDVHTYKAAQSKAEIDLLLGKTTDVDYRGSLKTTDVDLIPYYLKRPDTSINATWSSWEKDSPFLKQGFSRQALPQTIVDGVSDFLWAKHGPMSTSTHSISEPTQGKRLVTPKTLPLRMESVSVIDNSVKNSYGLAKAANLLNSSAKMGGLIGGPMALAGTALEYHMDNKDFTSTDFAIDATYNTSKGVLSGATGAYAGAAVTAAFVVFAPAAVAIGVGIVAGAAVGMGVSYAVDGFKSGVNYISENW